MYTLIISVVFKLLNTSTDAVLTTMKKNALIVPLKESTITIFLKTDSEKLIE